jgi:glycosyltransferase involved in cell wall biosynthesis
MALGNTDMGSDLLVLERQAHRDAAPAQTHARSTRVALVHLGHPGGLGTTRRVAVWRELLDASEADTVEINLLDDHRRLIPSPWTAVPALGGRVVPETATWSSRAAERAIRDADPDAVVFVTPRAFHPRLTGLGRHSILDFQDRFSLSYQGRASIDRRPGASVAWKTLAWAVDRFERRDHRVKTVAAGWSEAEAIGAAWIPNTIDAIEPDAITDHADAPFDVLFVGKLTALPNLDAMRRLAGLWPRVTTEVPGATCLIAGANLCDEVRELAAVHGWSTETDFDDVLTVCQRARVAVAPLGRANGIQNKVLEAAAAGLPQVVSPQALGGNAPGFPAMVARTREGMVASIQLLLQRPERRLALARAAHAHVVENYSVRRWAPVVHDLIEN